MSTKRRNIAIVYSILLAVGVFLVSFKTGRLIAASMLIVGAVLLDMMITRVFLSRKSLISFALCVIPAIFVWMFFCNMKYLWLILSIVCSVGLCYIYSGRLPDTRPTTDTWIGSLILTVILCITPFIISALLNP